MMLVSALIFCNLICLISSFGWDVETPLDKYVRRPDSHYGFKLIHTTSLINMDSYVLNMTSQKWKDESVLNHPIWWHYLVINVPKRIRFKDTALLYVWGGSYSTKVPNPRSDPYFPSFAEVADTTGMITAALHQVPNQKIIFKDDPLQMAREEDALIAYTWNRFLQDQSDPEILAEMAMTKAVVRALDTITTFTKQLDHLNDVEEFIITGASKRGWATWNGASVDKRIIAIVPMVMDLVNLQKSLQHHYRSLGGWSFAFVDYVNANVTSYVDDPGMDAMGRVINPYHYLERLTMPKLLITASGDEFFLVDDSHYFYDEMIGPKYLMICQNTHHTMSGHQEDILQALIAFSVAVKTKFVMPQLNWTREVIGSSGVITLRTSVKPKYVLGWFATTIDGKRDFRLLAGWPPRLHPVFWRNTPVEDRGNNQYQVTMSIPPEKMWLAFFIEATFDGPEGKLLRFMTEVHIIPETFPYPDCKGTDCRGHIV